MAEIEQINGAVRRDRLVKREFLFFFFLLSFSISNTYRIFSMKLRKLFMTSGKHRLQRIEASTSTTPISKSLLHAPFSSQSQSFLQNHRRNSERIFKFSSFSSVSLSTVINVFVADMSDRHFNNPYADYKDQTYLDAQHQVNISVIDERRNDSS